MARILFRNALFALGEFRCPPEHPRWESVNVMTGAPHVVFPGTTVVIHQLGHEPLVTNRNHVVYYSRDQRYRRVLRDPRGDECVFVAIAPQLLATLLESAHVRARDDGTVPFTAGPSDPVAYLAVSRTAHALRNGVLDALPVEELVYTALTRVVESARAFHASARRTRRLRTEQEHRRLAEDAKGLVSERFDEDDSLQDLAGMLYISPFHLARVFHDQTGFTLHGYRTQLRLRAALDHVLARSLTLSEIARNVGFKTHSQFTTAFRAAFGAPPSQLRSG